MPTSAKQQAMPEQASTHPTAAHLPARGTVFGFDFGLSRIGIAVGELETLQASALQVIHGEERDARFAAIGQLLLEWQPVALVVGIPFHLDGNSHALTQRCLRFANQLRGRTRLPVFESDERLSSKTAESELISVDKHQWRNRKPILDAVAAQIILQQFLDTLHNDSARR